MFCITAQIFSVLLIVITVFHSSQLIHSHIFFLCYSTLYFFFFSTFFLNNNSPKKIMSNIRGDLHVLMLKHSFVGLYNLFLSEPFKHKTTIDTY